MTPCKILNEVERPKNETKECFWRQKQNKKELYSWLLIDISKTHLNNWEVREIEWTGGGTIGNSGTGQLIWTEDL